MAKYVDAVVIPVPTRNLDSYREMASGAGRLWIDHGALEYFEGVWELTEDTGPMQTIPEVAETGGDESTVFAFITFESKAHRNEVHDAVMNDPAYREHYSGEMPFDPSRMATGSFTGIVNYEA